MTLLPDPDSPRYAEHLAWLKSEAYPVDGMHGLSAVEDDTEIVDLDESRHAGAPAFEWPEPGMIIWHAARWPRPADL